MRKILLLHGPNLNLLGGREPGHYGDESLDAINRRLVEQAKIAGASLEHFQSNSESALIERIHAAREARHQKCRGVSDLRLLRVSSKRRVGSMVLEHAGDAVNARRRQGFDRAR